MTRPYETATLRTGQADKKPAAYMASYLRKRLAEEQRKNPLVSGLVCKGGQIEFRYSKTAPAPGTKYQILGDGQGNFDIQKAREFFNRKGH
jgi:hypothetical protein